MKSLRSILIVLAWTISVLMIAQTAAAGGGKGPKGGTAAVAIDRVLLINPTIPSDRFTRAEIAGGGFLNGDFPVVTLNDEIILDVVEVSETIIVANIPATRPDGDYTLVVMTGAQSKQTASFTISLGAQCRSFVSTGSDRVRETSTSIRRCTSRTRTGMP